MGYWRYRQNNSGGSFTEPAISVWVQADTNKQADEVAQNNGIYFDPLFEIDCGCCGNRWEGAEGPYTEPHEPNENDLFWAESFGLPVQIVIKTKED